MRVLHLPRPKLTWMRCVYLTLLALAVAAMTGQSQDAPARPDLLEHDVIETLPPETRTNRVVAELEPYSKAPKQMAVLIDTDDFSKAQWTAFKSRLLLDLGSLEGAHKVWFGYKWETLERWSGHTVRVITKPPMVVFTDPTNTVTSQPMIQLKGYSTEPLSGLFYDVITSGGVCLAQNQQGFVNDQHYDKVENRFTTNFFTCYDIDLAPGTNTIVLRCADFVGNSLTTNVVYVFTTRDDPIAPAISVAFPEDGARVSGPDLTLDGQCDDPTANIVAMITDRTGHTVQQNALVERNGRFWVGRVPLTNAPLFITLVGIDAAGNSSLTNITVLRSRYRLTIDPVPQHQLWDPKVTVTGFCDDTKSTLLVNGVAAVSAADGRWTATNVPVRKKGVASFEVKTVPKEGVLAETDPPLEPQPSAWGEEREFLRAGLSVPLQDTNSYNSYPCFLDLAASASETTKWVLPTQQYRLALRLTNQAGKETPVRQWISGEKLGQPLPSGLNVQRLAKGRLEFFDGVLPFRTNSRVRLASLHLDDVFQLQPGQYRLEAVARLYKMQPNGDLTPFELPPVSTYFEVVDQPSPMAFRLKSLKAAGQLFLSGPRDSVRVAAQYVHDMRAPVRDEIRVNLWNQSTNLTQRFSLPRVQGEQFDLALYDEVGKEVQKTRLGAGQGKLPCPREELRGRVRARPMHLPSRDANECLRFDLHAHFNIRKPGKYRLVYKQHLYRRGERGELEGIAMPAVMVPIDLLIVPADW